MASSAHCRTMPALLRAVVSWSLRPMGSTAHTLQHARQRAPLSYARRHKSNSDDAALGEGEQHAEALEHSAEPPTAH